MLCRCGQATTCCSQVRSAQFDSIVAGVKSGKLAEADLDRNVSRILKLIEKTPRYQGYQYSNKPDLKAHAEVTRQSAAEGMVLMKNANALPFAEKIKNVALYGNTSYEFIAGGTGSGNVNHAYVVSLLDGMKNGGYVVSDDLKQAYEQFWSDYHKAREAEIAEIEKTDKQKRHDDEVPAQRTACREAVYGCRARGSGRQGRHRRADLRSHLWRVLRS